jgi:hypothetical protein
VLLALLLPVCGGPVNDDSVGFVVYYYRSAGPPTITAGSPPPHGEPTTTKNYGIRIAVAGR